MRGAPVVAVSALLLIAACADRRAGEDVAPASPGTASQPPAPDRWLGQWNGPEGTFLRITGGQGEYELTLQNLDGPRTFPGTASGDHIRFERDGVAEVIRATDGAGTGMKWLGEKSDCLTVRPGEGYCRK